jgi:Na+/proline symporter
MPPALGVLFLVTVVGIIISTADAFLLVPATSFIKDIYIAHIHPKASEKRIVFLSRLLVLAFGVIAYLVSLAFAESTTIFQRALYAYTIYGAAITPCLVAAIFWPGATKPGAIASIASGTVVTLAWEEMLKKSLPPSISELDAVLPAITVSIICLIVVSLLTRKKPSALETQRP